METQLTEPVQSQAVARPPRQKPPELDERRLPIVGHLEELRGRLLICLVTVGIASAASLAWTGHLIDWLKRPAGPWLPRLAFFSPPEALVAYMKVAVIAGLAVSMPVILYELWSFVRPGLTRRERRYGLAFVGWGSALFVAGGAFGYWVLLPVSLRFLLAFSGEQLEPVISISRYLSFTTMVIVACGVVFELPLAVFLLAKLGVVNPQMLRRQWRVAVLGIVIAAAILTPTTDVATMALMTVPMLVLYELAIWVAHLAAPRRRSQ